ncbi:MAG: hypothetical protein MI920_09045, partial [Kiloniellales bacterium]|nr:hypothetical protein [Kiloniellales bacterium]
MRRKERHGLEIVAAASKGAPPKVLAKRGGRLDCFAPLAMTSGAKTPLTRLAPAWSTAFSCLSQRLNADEVLEHAVHAIAGLLAQPRHRCQLVVVPIFFDLLSPGQMKYSDDQAQISSKEIAGGGKALSEGIFERDLDKGPANSVPLSPLSFLPRAAMVHPNHTAIVHGAQRVTWAE